MNHEQAWTKLKKWAETQPSFINISPTDVVNRMSKLENGESISEESVTRPISMSAEREAFEIVQAIRDLIIGEQARQDEHVHQWIVAGVSNPEMPQHPRSMIAALGNPVTYVLVRCRDCNCPMSMSLAGNWTEDQLKGVLDASSDTPSN